MPKRRTYHHGDLRRALMDALLELAAEQGGTGGVTLREVARRVGVSHNAPYRHFADKGELLAAVAEEGFVALADALRSARDAVDDPEERFVATGLAYIAFAHAHAGHIAVMFGPEIGKAHTPNLQRLANESFQVIKQLANDAGATELATTRRLGTVVWSFVHGLATLTERGQIPPSVGASARALAELGLRHLFESFRASAIRTDR